MVGLSGFHKLAHKNGLLGDKPLDIQELNKTLDQESKPSKELLNALNDFIDGLISNPLDEENRKKLVSKLRHMNKRELKACKRRLETLLKEDVLKLLFGNNLEQVKKRDFNPEDVGNYCSKYFWDTDFGQDFGQELCSDRIIIQKIGPEMLIRKFLLSVEKWTDRSITDGVGVIIPFKQGYFRGSDFYKIDESNVELRYRGNQDKIEHIVRLVEFLQGIKKCLDGLSDDRKLGLFGDVKE